MTEYLQVCLILGTVVHEGCILPLCFYEPVLFYLGQIDDIHAVCPVDGDAAASCDKAHYFVSRNRVTALREVHCHVIEPMYHNAAL